MPKTYEVRLKPDFIRFWLNEHRESEVGHSLARQRHRRTPDYGKALVLCEEDGSGPPIDFSSALLSISRLVINRYIKRERESRTADSEKRASYLNPSKTSKITLLLQSLEDEYSGLKSVVELCKETAGPNQPPSEEQALRVYCEQRRCELQIALDNVEKKLTALKEVYQSIMQTYKEATKPEKKEMLSEMEELKQKANFRVLMQDGECMSCEDDEYEDLDPCSLLSNADQKRSAQNPTTYHTSAEQHLELSPALRVKYPQLKLPHFDGQNESWEEFWGTFSLIIDQNSQLNDLEKILYLKDSIRGKAQQAIRSIPMRSFNYRLIVDVLQKKYGNKGNNGSKIVQRLMNIPQATSRAASCVATLDQVKDLVFQMIATGYDIRKKHDPLWIDTILAKFSYEIIKDCMKTITSGSRLTVGTLLEELQDNVSSRALFENRYSSLTSSHRRVDTSEQLTRANVSRTVNCIFCQRTNHQSENCRAVRLPLDRRQALRGQQVCWKCFSKERRSRDCTRQNCSNCNRDHHTTLCTMDTDRRTPVTPEEVSRSKEQLSDHANSQEKEKRHKNNYRNQSSSMVASEGQPAAEQRNESQSLISSSNLAKEDSHQKQLVLMTVEAQVKNNKTGAYENVLLFLDSGAQCNLIEATLADNLALVHSEPYQCTMYGIGGIEETYIAQKVTAEFRTRFGESVSLTLGTKPVLTKAFPSAALTCSDVQFLKRNNIFLSNTATNGELIKPHILIGVEAYENIVMLDSPPTKLPSGLLAQNTVFGPALFGKSDTVGQTLLAEHVVVACPETLADVKQELRQMYELEGMGISTDEYRKDDTAYDYLDSYAKRIMIEDGRIVAPLPLKDNVVELDSNFKVAVSRLRSLFKFHVSHPEQRTWYIKILDEYKSNDVIEEVPSPEQSSLDNITYYIPHTGVWRSEKPTPLRIVFDASSKSSGKPPLNDVVHTGESFVNKIQDILMTCRWCSILVAGDIQAAFTQIRIIPEHRDLLRFVWLTDPDKPPTHDNIAHYRFIPLPFGIRSSPSVLNMSLTAFLTNSDLPLAKEILDNIYVDNVFLNASTIQEALAKIESSRALFANIGMNLREFSSNSTEVNAGIPQQARCMAKPNKLLDVKYDTITDRLSLTIPFLPKRHMTKRKLVSEVYKLYDLLGLAAPLSLRARMLMRDAVMLKAGWNKPLDPEFLHEWNELCLDISGTVVTIPRSIGSNSKDTGNATLWVFEDASQVVISCCSYVSHPPENDTKGLLCAKTMLSCHFLVSFFLLVPQQRQLPIPRLELLAILISVRLAKTIVTKYRHRLKYVHIAENAAFPRDTKQPIYIPNDSEKEQGLPFAKPDMAPLPGDRSVISKTFQNVGCDYLGPFTTDADEEVANSFWNRWHNEYLTELRDAHKAVHKQQKNTSRSQPEIGEIVLIQQDGIVTRSNWPFGRVVEFVKSSDGLIRTAKVLTSSGKTIQRPISKLTPLEISSKIYENDGNKRSTGQKQQQLPTRILPPRKAKQNKKYHDEFPNEEELSHSHIVATSNTIATRFLYPLLVLALAHTSNASHILCAEGKVSVKPPSDTYTLCLNDACRNRTVNDTSTFVLPPSAHHSHVNVTLHSHAEASGRQGKMCRRSKFCDDKTIFTLSLLGNPHCWPFGAIFTAVCIVATAILLVVLCSMVVKKIVPKCSTHPITKLRNQSPAVRTHVDMRPSKFVVVALLALTTVPSETHACQHPHTRHSTELVCNDSNMCTIEYEREFLFNKLHREVCVYLKYRNQTIGNLEISLERTRHKCNKETLFSRDTSPRVFSKKRCPFMGSCLGDTCFNLRANDSVPELREAEVYPGYSKCSETCGGIICGCLGLPLAGCLFYRVAHMPLDNVVYQIYRCPSWSPEVHLRVRPTSAGKETSQSVQLYPYVQQNVTGWNMGVFSLQYLFAAAANRRFAESLKTHMILDDRFKVAVECPSADAALRRFNSCRNRIMCACSTNSNAARCLCPQHTFRAMRNSTAVLPLSTVHYNISAADTVSIDSHEAEVTVAITSRKEIQMI
ncbi:hypothetical protein RB195_014336 [Necator americanus]|uniref:DUF5641 domain-containing protein n=1 Tax=Necator americanus TaxID=51031 RepID=A0ABR1E180_NECAM